jgi:integrase
LTGSGRPPDTFELDPRERNPGFHEFATDWLTRFKRGKSQRTAEVAEYLLTHHALPFLKDYRLDEIDYAVLSSLVARRLQRNDEIEQARAAGVKLKSRNGQPRRTVGPRTINMTLDIVSRILADAVKRGLLHTNPAADRELRLKVTHRRGNFLEADELLVLLEAAGTLDQQISPRTLQRAGRARELRAGGRSWAEVAEALEVTQGTAVWLAGRTLSSAAPAPEELCWRRLAAPVTPHPLRRTYITLMLEAGAPVPYVQGQVGHEDAATTLNIYAQVIKRQDRRRHGEAFDALMAGAVPSGGPLMIPGSSTFLAPLVTETDEIGDL